MRRAAVSSLIVVALLAGALFAAPALAQVNVGLTPEVGEALGLGTTDIRITVARVIRNFIGLLGIIAVVLIMYGGFLWMTAAGNEERIDKARRVITAAVIGLAIVLSSFAIAQFVLSRLVEATGAGGLGPVGGGGGGGGLGGGGGSGATFVVRGFSPSGAVPIRNVTARAVFNQNVDAGTVDGNVRVTLPDGTPVDGTYTTSGSAVEFVPSAACPPPNEDRRCFAADADFRIEVGGGLRSVAGLRLTCALSGDDCRATFRTGSIVDVAAPSLAEVLYPDDGQSVFEGDLVPVQVRAVDDAGISSIDVTVDGGSIGRSVPAGLSADFTGVVDWDTTASPLGRRRIAGTAYDLDANSLPVDGIGVMLRPAHCGSGVQDGDETGVDCGGSCGSCGGGSCGAAGDCSSGVCRAGTCADVPVIEGMSPRDGGPGTIVTLSGRAFGSPGSVLFLGGPGAADDVVASTCDAAAWTATEITVTVPTGAVTGPMRVITAGGEQDDTDDARGPVLGAFTVNTAVRPGICRVEPARGRSGDGFTLVGAGFGDAGGAADAILFTVGGRDTAAPTPAADAWNPADIRSTVPTLSVAVEQRGEVRVRVGGVESNRKAFAVLPAEAGTLPRIDAVDPGSGPVTEYVTLRGSAFGARVGRVLFQLPDGTTADAAVDFPAVCGDRYWTDTAVTVKVPAFYRGGATGRTPVQLSAHDITLERADGARSNSVAFTVTGDVPRPGLCALVPDNGPADTRVRLLGERFGSTPGAVTFFDAQAATVDGPWSDTEVQNARAPVGAASGPVTVTGLGSAPSNGLPFALGMCTDDASCGPGRQCCADGTCRLDCSARAPEGAFLWRFSTGDIPVLPRVVEDAACVGTTQSPSPFRATRDACVNAIISARFTAEMDPASFGGAVAVAACGAGETFDDTACAGSVGGRVEVTRESVVVGATTRYTSRMTFTPSAAFDGGTWYRVTLASAEARGIRSVEGIALDGDRDEVAGGDYVYAFRTRPSSEPCGVDHVEVSPGRFIATQEGEEVDYRADPTAANCNLLMCTGYAWEWTHALSGGGDATRFASLADDAADPSPPNSCRYVATALSETDPADPVRVRAAIPAEGKSDEGILDINYLDPRVTEHGPMCEAACINAEVHGSFNVAMDPASLTAATVRILTCRNESCRSFVEAAGVPGYGLRLQTRTSPVTGRTETVGFVLEPRGAASLRPGTWYRVIVSGGAAGVRSRSGAALAGANYGDGFSWTFRTKDDTTPCDVAAVSVNPSRASVQVLGDVARYDVIARGAPDDCDVDGQRLDAADYSWDWSAANDDATRAAGVTADVATIDFLTTPGSDPSGKDLLPLVGNAYCTNACLLTGSVGSLSVCGNARVERGEDCDDGNTASGDGCSDRCLHEGTGTPVCGNARLERGEDCDDGNTINGDGCSAECLNEGSASGAAVCGNGDLGDGEDCDDGNTASGDGCSAECLNEGSVPGPVSVCGNGVVESGETCDDGNLRAGDGCSDYCLAEGNPTRCAAGAAGAAGCCGNGVVDADRFETCDDGNSVSGDGCSGRCLSEGSNARYGFSFAAAAYCGTGAPPEAPAEQCEFPGPTDGNLDPDASLRGAAGGTSVVRAATRNRAGDVVAGTAAFTMDCSCTLDSECAAFVPGGSTATVGCGTGGCCAPRPRLQPPFTPADGSTDVCRNALIAADFTMRMDSGSLIGNVLLAERLAGGGPCPAGRELPGVAGFCVSSSTVGIVDIQKTVAGGGLVTELRIEPRAPLAPSTEYRVIVKGDPRVDDAERVGVRSVDGVPMNGDAYWSFTTGTEICTLDVVGVAPRTYLFSTAQNDARDDGPGAAFDTIADNDKVYRAAGYTRRAAGRLEAIVSTPSYAWGWQWTSSDGDRGEASSWRHLEYPVSTGDNVTVRTIGQPQNGDVTLTAVATVTASVLGASCDPAGTVAAQEAACGVGRRCGAAGTPGAGHCYGETRSGSAVATVLLCENPWPSRAADGTWAPFTDTDFHFSTYFCRDAGVQGRADDLPAPADAAVTVGGAGPGSALLGIISDKLLPLQCAAAGELCQPGDAFGIRVLRNREHYTPARWYAKQGFTGSPTPSEVDGYDAVQEGRSVYVNAGNKYGDPQLFTNIYLLSHNEGASETTRRIFASLLENLRFNTNLIADNAQVCSVSTCSNDPGRACIADADCGAGNVCAPTSCVQDADCAVGSCRAPKDKFTRDVQRLQDFTEIDAKMETYYGLNSVCEDRPETRCLRDADCGAGDRCVGSYPNLAAGSFVAGLSTSRWPSWQAALGNALGGALPQDPLNTFASGDDEDEACSPREGYEAETCWDPGDQTYQCPARSRIYEYRKRGRGYELSADFEFRFCAGDLNRLCDVDADCGPGDRCSVANWTDVLEPVSHAAVGITNVFRYQDACLADSATSGVVSAAAGTCGDGILNAGEECEIGDTGVELCSEGGTAGGRRWTCTDSCAKAYGTCAPARCGDGIVSSGEACDDGTRNGQYGFCGITCTGLAAHCGDGSLQSGETCDLGGLCSVSGTACNPAAGRGCPAGEECLGTTVYNRSAAASCAPDCRGVGPFCGDGTVNAGYGEVCEPGQSESEGCGTDAAGREMRRTRTCTADCGGFGAWSTCSVVTSCGDGVVQRDAGEQCDDGNRNENDGCRNDCTTNVCGDRVVNVGVEECDAGTDNIDLTSPGALERARSACAYGRTCNYCSNTCRGVSVSGGVCGDGTVTPPYEACEEGDLSRVVGRTSASRCAPDCSNACPPTFTDHEVRFQPRAAPGDIGTRRFAETTLTSGQDDTDIVLPACRPGTLNALVADVAIIEDEEPATSILLVTDLSGSMRTAVSAGRTRLQEAVGSQADDGGAIDRLVSAYAGRLDRLNIGLLSFEGPGSGTPVTIRSTSDYLPGQPDLLTMSNPGARRALKEVVRSYALGGGTPTRSAAEEAQRILAAAPTGRKIVILLSDGQPSPGEDPSATFHDLKLTDRVEVYTIAFTTSASLIANMSVWSGACFDEPATPGTPTCYTGGSYDYSSSDDLDTIYGAIVRAITSVETRIGSASATVEEGIGVTLPGAGTAYTCTGRQTNLPFSVRFAGDGVVRISRVRLSACPATGETTEGGTGVGGTLPGGVCPVACPSGTRCIDGRCAIIGPGGGFGP